MTISCWTHEGRSRRSIAMDRRTGGRSLQQGRRREWTVVLIPSLGCRVLMVDVFSRDCGVGGASLATRRNAGKRHAVWWTDSCGGLYEKTRSSSMAATGFRIGIRLVLDAPVVAYFMSPLPEVRQSRVVLSSCPHHWCDVHAVSKPIRHHADVRRPRSPGKRRKARRSFPEVHPCRGDSSSGYPKKFVRKPKLAESLSVKESKYARRITCMKCIVNKKYYINQHVAY